MPTNRLVEKEIVATYASVLLEGALAQGGQDAAMQVRDQAELVVRTMRSNADLAEALGSHAYTAEQRGEIARNTFEGFNPALVDMLAVMAERGEGKLLSRVLKSFEEKAQAELGTTIVDVTTVVELDDHLRELITRKVENEFGTKVVLREHIDPAILGGILMSANGKRIDASVLSQLEKARGVLKQQQGGEARD